MIEPHIARYFELSEQAVHELLLLTSIYDCLGLVPGQYVLRNIQKRGYFRHNVSRLTHDLQYFLPDTGYVERVEAEYRLTRKGLYRMRDLSELTHANPSVVTQLNKEGFDRIREVRTALGMYPFTRGRLTKDGAQERDISGYCVYAVLLSESALQIRYRIQNPHHNPKMPCIYVGMSSYKPRERFDNHRFGFRGHSSKYVYFNGYCLVPLLYSHLNEREMGKEDALRVEQELAGCLRNYGFAVFAGHHDIEKGIAAKTS